MTQPDSITDVNIVWDGSRSVHSFRCNDKLWEAFVSEVKARGDSVCHYIEPMLTAFLIALKPNVYNRNTLKKNSVPNVNVTIKNFHVQRVVQRHRRITLKDELEPNMYDSKLFTWVYVPDAVLNDNGHVVGCVCKICRSRDV